MLEERSLWGRKGKGTKISSLTCPTAGGKDVSIAPLLTMGLSNGGMMSKDVLLRACYLGTKWGH